MPLTQAQLDAFDEVLEGTESAPRGLKIVFGELCTAYDRATTFRSFWHTRMADDDATDTLLVCKTYLQGLAQELGALLE